MDKILEALDKLLRTCLEFFGPNITVLLIIVVPLGLFLWRWYSDRVKRQETRDALDAKEQTIQILADEVRHLRVIHLKNLGWTDEAIEAVIMKNTPKDAVEARKLLEDEKKDSDKPKRNKKNRKK